MVEPLIVNQGEHLLGLFAEGNATCAIDFLGHSLDFGLGCVVVLIGEVHEWFGRILLDGLDYFLGQLCCAFTTMGEAVVDDTIHAEFIFAMVNKAANLLVGVVVKTVERYNNRLAEALHVGHVTIQIGKASFKTFEVGLLDLVDGYAAVHLQAVARGDDDGELGAESCLAAFDVEELLGSQISTKTRLGDAIVGQRHAKFGAQNRVAAVCDVTEWASMNNGGGVLGGLHEVG